MIHAAIFVDLTFFQIMTRNVLTAWAKTLIIYSRRTHINPVEIDGIKNMENKMDKRNLYKTGRIISENAFCQIIGFDPGDGEGGHYKVGSVVYPDRRTADFGGALSIPASQIDMLML